MSDDGTLKDVLEELQDALTSACAAYCHARGLPKSTPERERVLSRVTVATAEMAVNVELLRTVIVMSQPESEGGAT